MNLKEELLRGIYAYGFEKPSAIQQRAIVPCIKGLDVIAQAQSGTGKTATFSIAILEKIDTGLRECQALILAPTRELAQQIQKVNLECILSSCNQHHTQYQSQHVATSIRPNINVNTGGYEPWRLHGSSVPRLHWRNLSQVGFRF